MTQSRLSRSGLVFLGLMLAATAFADERILVVQGVGIQVESDQERMYVIPGGGIYSETLTAVAPAGRSRGHVIGP